jgi:Leucine-rich repeat (LRR) protein
MAPSVSVSVSISTSIVVAAWAISILICGTYLDTAARFVAASELPSLEGEAKALLESGWWSGYNKNTSIPCKWYGITCNAGGSVTKIAIRLAPRFYLGEMSKLNLSFFSNLVHLDLSYNELQGSISLEIGTLSKLIYLDLSNNNLTGKLPLTLANLTQLELFDISFNQIIGPIPSSLWLLTNLTDLVMHRNQISGFIAPEIGMLKSLTDLDLAYNMFIGPIPSTLGHLTNLKFLHLDSNQINGSIPSEIYNLKNLLTLVLGNNNLSGQIPSTLGHLTNLLLLILSENQINGSIPVEIGNLKSLLGLYLYQNNFIGHIPTQIRNLHLLVNLDLSQNFLSGEVPIEVGDFDKLLRLNLSYNNFTGNIPRAYVSIKRLNLSYNSLEGPIPYSYDQYHTFDTLIGNKNLCGVFEYFPPCLSLPAKSKSIATKVKIFVPITISLGFLVLVGFLLSRHMRKKTQLKSRETKNGNLFSIWNYDGHIAYDDIIEATEDFDIKYCIGTGGYGSVYKAELHGGKVIALKKLHMFEAENPTFDMSFKNEIKMLTEIRHRNIIKLLGFCLHKRCMFLIYEYMERGSLFCVLNNDVEAMELDWSKRVNIIKGTAHALSYMHHECIPTIVHRDITSNNILLNSKLEAFVSDFGTARLLNPDSSNQTLVAGTYGYIAPGELFFPFYKLYTYLFIYTIYYLRRYN